MATKTKNLQLTKPEMSDYADIRFINNNSEILDREITALKNKTYPYLPLSGGTMTGDITSSNATGLGLRGAISWDNGASIDLRANTDTSAYKGCAIIDANLDGDNCRLILKPTGDIETNKSLNFSQDITIKGNALYALLETLEENTTEYKQTVKKYIDGTQIINIHTNTKTVKAITVTLLSPFVDDTTTGTYSLDNSTDVTNNNDWLYPIQITRTLCKFNNGSSKGVAYTSIVLTGRWK